MVKDFLSCFGAPVRIKEKVACEEHHLYFGVSQVNVTRMPWRQKGRRVRSGRMEDRTGLQEESSELVKAEDWRTGLQSEDIFIKNFQY